MIDGKKVKSLWPPTRHNKWMNDREKKGWVSVIVPTFNRSTHLIKSINSVHKQVYRPIELIIVDDGSTDDTEMRTKIWAKKHHDSLFHVNYLFQQNAGPSSARNLGLIHSTGEYIQFLDSDDRIHPQKISVQVKAIESSAPCDIVISENIQFNSQKEEPNFPVYNENSLIKNVRTRHINGVSLQVGNLLNSLYRRYLCVEAGPINENLRWMEDVEYNIRMSALASSVCFIDVPFLAFSRHGGDHLTEVQDKEEGLDAGFASVNTMESILDGLSVPEGAQIRYKIGTFYLKLAQLALRVGNLSQFRRALDGSLRNRLGPLFKSKVYGILVVQRIFGADLCHQFWDWVTGFGAFNPGSKNGSG